MFALVLLACDPPPPAAGPGPEETGESSGAVPRVPVPDRARYAGCAVDIATTHPDLDLVDRTVTTVFDDLGWELEQRSDWAGDGVVDEIVIWEGRNPWGLYTAREATYAELGPTHESGVYDEAFWLSRTIDAASGPTVSWSYHPPTETGYSARVEGGAQLRQRWELTLEAGRVTAETLTDLDGSLVYENTWTYDGDLLVSADLRTPSREEHDDWSYQDGAVRPFQLDRVSADRDGAETLHTRVELEWDAFGREASTTSVDDGPFGTPELTTWTWRCPGAR